MRRSLLLGLVFGMAWASLSAEELTIFDAPLTIKTHGEVLVTMPGGAQRPLKAGEVIPLGAKLETGESGDLLLSLHPGMSFLLGNNSVAYISHWSAEPQTASFGIGSPATPPNPSSATVILNRGTLYAVIERGTHFERRLTLETNIGRFTSQGGGFAIANLIKSIQVVTLVGDLNIDTRFDQSTPSDIYQYRLGEAHTMVIPQTGEMKVQDPFTHKWIAPQVNLINDDDSGQFFCLAAIALMESMSNKIVDDQALTALVESLATKVKARQIQPPIIMQIGQELTAMIKAGQISPTVAQGFINDSMTQGLALPEEISKGIQQAILTWDLPSPATPTGQPTVVMDPGSGPSAGIKP